MFIVLFGMVAIGCTLVVLKTWLLRRRIPRAAGGWALASTIAVLLSLLAAPRSYTAAEPSTAPEPLPASTFPSPMRVSAARIAAEQARVDEMHRQFAPALEQHRQAHGAYPSTLLQAGIAAPMTRYGRLYYYGSSSKTVPWYLISFGDIEVHHFSADWDSRKGEWSLVQLDF